ncbi:MAG TPA: hypothetical protein PLU30_25590 [Verrucomicrobiae bacterium]|nr:hypothetical protein [Verrucomicrobiae bacterium]
MKAQRTNDPELGRAMNAWRVDVEVPPGFQANVWRRIRLNEERRKGRWLWLRQACEWLAADIRFAAALPALALIAGFVLGMWHDKAAGTDPRTQFQIAYVDSLDPYTLAAQHVEDP